VAHLPFILKETDPNWLYKLTNAVFSERHARMAVTAHSTLFCQKRTLGMIWQLGEGFRGQGVKRKS
jgi:hypothetical protein